MSGLRSNKGAVMEDMGQERREREREREGPLYSTCARVFFVICFIDIVLNMRDTV